MGATVICSLFSPPTWLPLSGQGAGNPVPYLQQEKPSMLCTSCSFAEKLCAKRRKELMPKGSSEAELPLPAPPAVAVWADRTGNSYTFPTRPQHCWDKYISLLPLFEEAGRVDWQQRAHLKQPLGLGCVI